MSTKLIQSIPISHYSFILQTFNRILSNNCYSDHWKLSKLILLPKTKTTLLSIDQKRPISLISLVSAKFSNVVFYSIFVNGSSIILFYLLNNRVFVKVIPTPIVSRHFLQHVTSGLQQHTASLVIYVDFVKAFDQLWHDALIYKLFQLQCPSELLTFIIEYLRNCKCFISLNESISPSFSVQKGVPQGSCLGPLLFLLFHSELPHRIPSASYSHLFADDLAVIVHASPW